MYVSMYIYGEVGLFWRENIDQGTNLLPAGSSIATRAAGSRLACWLRVVTFWPRVVAFEVYKWISDSSSIRQLQRSEDGVDDAFKIIS